MNENPKFEFLEHTADLKIRVQGKTLNGIFENAALAISQYLSPDKKIEAKKVKVINAQGSDSQSLLLNFLDELLYLLDAENFAVAKTKVTLRGNNLEAEISGDSASKYAIKEIKAATYAEMYIKKLGSEWEAQFVMDI